MTVSNYVNSRVLFFFFDNFWHWPSSDLCHHDSNENARLSVPWAFPLPVLVVRARARSPDTLPKWHWPCTCAFQGAWVLTGCTTLVFQVFAVGRWAGVEPPSIRTGMGHTDYLTPGPAKGRGVTHLPNNSGCGGGAKITALVQNAAQNHSLCKNSDNKTISNSVRCVRFIVYVTESCQ